LGQDHIVHTLEGALQHKKVSHAYLFSGPRGTGKTSVARILAKELGTTQSDLYEIDGASNRGIDEVRELKENIRTLPFSSPMKVYVIDEVHMLTKEAFNALLKTLEEPPAYVVFILATTEFHKVPDTIVSRCQHFIFKKPTEATLKKMALDVAQKEKVALDDDAASLIAFLGDGSFRDTQGILEQIIQASSGKKIERQDVEAVTGAPNQELVRNFIEGILEGKLETGLSAIEKGKKKNIDIKLFSKLVMKYMRFGMLMALAPETEAFIQNDVGDDEFNYIKSISKHPRVKIFPEALRILIDAYDDIRRAYVPELPLELALIKILEKGI